MSSTPLSMERSNWTKVLFVFDLALWLIFDCKGYCYIMREVKGDWLIDWLINCCLSDTGSVAKAIFTENSVSVLTLSGWLNHDDEMS